MTSYKNKRWLKRILFALIAALPFSGCTDELLFNPYEIGEGEAIVSVSVDYEPHKASLDKSTRAAGNAISKIETLSVVIYERDDVLYKVFNSSEGQLKFTETEISSIPDDYEGNKAEDKTARVEFSFPEPLPYGYYRMYVVANMGTVTEEMAEDPEALKSQTVAWQFTDSRDPEAINANMARNAQMFGYLTKSGGSNETSVGFQAPEIAINTQHVSLHSWVKRLASKVTIAYDGSGLNDNVWVYVHNVSLRQIPLNCTLGEPNHPRPDDITSDDYAGLSKPAKGFSSGQFFYYNSKGEVSYTDEFPNQYQYSNWMMLANGLGTRGAVDHTQSDPALYFYENLQGDFSEAPDKERYDKRMTQEGNDAAGTNVTPDMEDSDWKDRRPNGTFIEVEAYYVSSPSNDPAHKSQGPIKYRFMLGQDDKYNYDAFRNNHYKLTLGFRGWANQPDWHIEYKEEQPEIVATETFMPYLYNQSAEFPIRLNGNVIDMEMEIIENNWGPYEEGQEYNVPPAVVGSDSPEDRIYQFRWYRDLFVNNSGFEDEEPRAGSDPSTANYLYGRHKFVSHSNSSVTAGYKNVEITHLEGDAHAGESYYVSPIWVGFLRLQQPEAYESYDVKIPMNLLVNDEDPTYRYDNTLARAALKKYYFGIQDGGRGAWINTTRDLSKRTFKTDDLTPGPHGVGRNSYTVENLNVDGVPGKAVSVKLWTQPKSMMYISGFSGNNPYEAYNRKAVIRITAHFKVYDKEGNETIQELKRDVPIIQARRLVNPKGIWRTSDDTAPFHFVLYDNQTAATSDFAKLQSRGSWSAKIIAGSGITITPEAGSYASGGGVAGKTESNVTFQINFPGGQNFALIEILYHGNSAKHYVVCRQGYRTPTAVVDGGARWSSYALYSCAKGTTFGIQESADSYVESTLTVSPLALGTLFKKGNYDEGIRISNLDLRGARVPPGEDFKFVLSNGDSTKWLDIYGIARQGDASSNSTPGAGQNTSAVTQINNITYNSKTWKWAKFHAKDKDGEALYYRVPTYADFEELIDPEKNADVAVGVLYADGATEPKPYTKDAYGYFDVDNNDPSDEKGMRGFFVYNNKDARNIFFPIGVSGMGRRTMQNLQTPWKDYAGVMRYSSVTRLLTYDYQNNNVFRPIAYDMPNVPGALYWFAQEKATASNAFTGWDLNYFNLDFNPYDYAMSIGPYGDAVPIKLVIDENAPTTSTRAARKRTRASGATATRARTKKTTRKASASRRR